MPVIADRLAHDSVGALWLQAAALLADGRLVAPLEDLRRRETDDQDGWDEQLASALRACRSQQPAEH